VYRPEIMRTTRQALNLTAQGGVTLHEASLRIRDKNRHLGRPISCRAVGSTLLLKGLEADIAIVLNPDQMDANHLYVALTRGARQLIVCSQTPVLNPA
jgi:DNA helicase-2/ATP-dependent DNA helicase PcrA